MAVKVKLRCSECETVLDTELKAEDKEIVCVVCGRRMANMPADDYKLMEAGQKSQRTMSIVAIVLFLAAIICLYFWIGDTGEWVSGKGPTEPNVGPMAGAIVCALAALILGIIASLKRFVVEF
jgi:DNA-directed RNA polymerase subunit RPC12/RpoP